MLCKLSIFRDSSIFRSVTLAQGSLPTAIAYLGNMTIIAMGSGVFRIDCSGDETEGKGAAGERRRSSSANQQLSSELLWSLPGQAMADEEIQLWKQAQQNAISVEELLESLVNLRTQGNVLLSNHAVGLLNMIGESDDLEALAEARFDYVSSTIAHQLGLGDWTLQDDTIVSLKTIDFSPVNSGKVLVLGTEMQRIYLLLIRKNGGSIQILSQASA